MPKTIKNVFFQNLTFIKLYDAHIRASFNKKNRRDVIAFEMDLETNLMNLFHQIKNGDYCHGEYHTFVIHEPKERLIQSLPYQDRIVHQWYVEEFIIPYFVPKFIVDTHACIRGRGTHKAVDKLQYYMRLMKRKYGSYYVLKCDIHKYFYSINRDVLFSILKKSISDKDLLKFTYGLIFDGNGDVGIPIGNYTSQYFANIYLNELDHYMKEILHIPYYVRYMDDFVLLVRTKEEARKYMKLIEKYLRKRGCPKINHLILRQPHYPNHFGIDFCGYRIYETHRLFRKRSKDKIKNIIRQATHDFKCDIFDSTKFQRRYSSWLAHAHHANAYNLVQKYSNQLEFLNSINIESNLWRFLFYFI